MGLDDSDGIVSYAYFVCGDKGKRFIEETDEFFGSLTDDILSSDELSGRTEELLEIFYRYSGIGNGSVGMVERLKEPFFHYVLIRVKDYTESSRVAERTSFALYGESPYDRIVRNLQQKIQDNRNQQATH